MRRALNTGNVTSTGMLLTTQDVPLSGGVAAFDVTQFVRSKLGQAVTLQVIADAPDGQRLGVNSKEAASGQPQLLLTSSFLNDVPAPIWALNVIPTDSSPSAGGPSSSDSVNLASGVEENTPGPDIAGRNPVGPSAVFSRMYRSVQAAKGYASPGLSPGRTHNYDITVYLTSITDPYHRTVNYVFGQTNGGYCLTGVSQLGSTAPQWQYDYTAINGWPLLSSVGAPDPSVIPAAGSTAAIPILTHPISYYPDGRVATLVDANGNRRLYTYAGGTQVQVYSPGGALVDHWTQASGQLNNAMGYTDANNASNSVVYNDPANPYRPTQFTNRNPGNPQTVSATYDPYGNTLTTLASCNGGFVQTNYQYDYATFALGMLSSVQTQGMAGSVHYSYYPNGLVQTVTTPSPGYGLILPTTTFYYTALGNISTIMKPGPNATGQTVSIQYNYLYDPLDGTRQTEALGQPLTVTAPDGGITHYRYDAHGNCTAVIDALGNRTDFVFNAADQLVSTILPATGQTGTGRAHTDITYQYVGGPAIATKAFDESGNTAPIRQVGQTSGKEGEGLAQTGNTEQASFSYDAEQKLNTLKDGNGNAFQHVYDQVGNLSQLTYPSGNSIQGQYDLDGNLTQFTNARGQNFRTTLVPNDSLPQSVLHADGHSDQFVYDRFGRTSEVSDGNTTLDYTYDDLGDVLSVTTQYANLPISLFTNYTYFPDGSRATMAQNGNSTSYIYDLCGRVTDIVNNCRDGSYHFDYDLAGNLIHKKTPESETTYQYNALHQLVGMTNYDGFHNVISDYSGLRYDGAGNLTQQTITTPSLNTAAQGQTVAGTVNYTYDVQDHLTREQSQRNLAVTGLGGLFNNFDNASVSDAADNLTSLRGVTFTPNLDNQVAADSNGAGYGYDLDGNATTEEGVSIQYDDAGRITAYDDPTLPLHLRMGYRPDGLRAWKQVNGGPLTYFLYDGDRLTMEFQAQSDGTALSTRCYGWGAAGLEQIDYPSLSNEPTIFYAFDPQGNLVNRLQHGVAQDLACFDAFGDWVGDFSYIGNVGIWIDPFSDPIGWGGQWGAYTDTPGYAGVSLGGARHAGLILLTHRYYNPDTGRFLTRDPIGYEGGANVYAYCRNNPVMGCDPSGLTEGWDLIFLAWDAGNIIADYVTGAPAAETAMDWGALGIDGALTLIPGAPAGPGHFAMAGAKASLQVATKVSQTARAAQGIYHTASSTAKLVDLVKDRRTVEPKLPQSSVASHGDVEFKHYYGGGGDHLELHMHVIGGGRETKILPNGQPMKGFTPLTQQQMRAFMLNKPAIRKAFNKLGRYINTFAKNPGA